MVYISNELSSNGKPMASPSTQVNFGWSSASVGKIAKLLSPKSFQLETYLLRAFHALRVFASLLSAWSRLYHKLQFHALQCHLPQSLLTVEDMLVYCQLYGRRYLQCLLLHRALLFECYLRPKLEVMLQLPKDTKVSSEISLLLGGVIGSSISTKASFHNLCIPQLMASFIKSYLPLRSSRKRYLYTPRQV